jgi:NitT/TauT family transport system ATP-binding protein
MLEIKALAKSYGDIEAIREISIGVSEGEFVCVVGPSGCGKTTLLKSISGLIAPTRGEIVLRGRRVTEPPSEMALVFQEYTRSLLPWMSVRGNVALPLRNKRLAKHERVRLVEEAVEAVGLARFIDRYPWELSGGMQQRVAIARALAYQPEILLMDEPFASVDAQTRGDLEDLILQVRERYGVTIVFVTHDIDESVYLADRIVVLSPSPTTVKEIVPVDLPHPRDQVETKELAEFAQLRRHVYRSIKREQPDVTPRRLAGDRAARNGWIEDRDLLVAILQFAARQPYSVVFRAAALYWSYARASPEGLDVLADALTRGPADQREAALQILADGPCAVILANPAWVDRVLDGAAAATLDELQGALSASLRSGFNNGRPCLQDIELRDRASEHADAARPGSRAAAFWTSMVHMAEAEIECSLKLAPSPIRFAHHMGGQDGKVDRSDVQDPVDGEDHPARD